MTQIPSAKRIHPLVAAAAVSIIVVSLVGVAAITGVIPTSNSAPTPDSQMAAADRQEADARNQDATVTPAANGGSKETAQQQDKLSHKAKAETKYQQKDSDNNTSANVAQAPAICESCGVVESVRTVERAAQKGSGLGAAAGAVLGGVLGHQVGGGNGRKLATVAGAVGGGFAGNEIEKRNNTNITYEVRVRMENGNTRTFTPSAQPDWRAGDHVRIVDGRLTSNER